MENNQRILLVTWNYPPKIGGMENLLFELVQQIRSRTTVGIIAPCSDEPGEKEAEGMYRARFSGLIWFFIYSIIKGSQLLAAGNFDVIVGGSALTSPIVYLLGKIHKKPVAVYAHGLDLIYKNFLYQFAIRALIPKMDLVITNSSQTKEIARKLSVPEESLSVVHPGIRADDFDTTQNEVELKEKYDLAGKFLLLYVGRLAKRKGIPEFIEHSLPDIVKRYENVVFCIVGGNPEKSLIHKMDIQQLIERKITEKGLEEHVRLFGWVDRAALIELYLACDIFLLPAIYVPDDVEGFGIVLAEANAAGKPVVSSAIGGIQDAVVNKKSGILIEPGNWGEYSEAIIHLIEDGSLRDSMGNYGYKRVEQDLDWPVIGRKFLEIINRIDQV